MEQKEGADDGKEGRITVINTASDTVERTIVSNPLAPNKVGFKSNGSTLDRIPPRNNDQNQPIFDFGTGCFPNVLWGMAVKNGRLYVPAIGSSPNGPFRFVTGQPVGKALLHEFHSRRQAARLQRCPT